MSGGKSGGMCGGTNFLHLEKDLAAVPRKGSSPTGVGPRWNSPSDLSSTSMPYFFSPGVIVILGVRGKACFLRDKKGESGSVVPIEKSFRSWEVVPAFRGGERQDIVCKSPRVCAQGGVVNGGEQGNCVGGGGVRFRRQNEKG